MNAFNIGFTDELVKLGGALGSAAKWVGKSPLKRGVFPALTALLVGSAGYAGVKASQQRKRRVIRARPGRPTQAVMTDYHSALGLKKRPTRLQRRRMSRNLPSRYRTTPRYP